MLQAEFDSCIRRLDRMLFEFLLLFHTAALNECNNRQTLKHHADDLIGVGQRMLSQLERLRLPLPEPDGPVPLTSLQYGEAVLVCYLCGYVYWLEQFITSGPSNDPDSVVMTIQHCCPNDSNRLGIAWRTR